ncbi:MAG: hypothetical protein KGI66_04900, partial [Patescibacteria group bacterium]|nr:hypothetical protein [Patescibacteria group bacterium]
MHPVSKLKGALWIVFAAASAFSALPAIAAAQVPAAQTSAIQAPAAQTASIPGCPEGYTCVPNMERIFYISGSYLKEALADIRTRLSPGDVIAPQLYILKSDLNATGSIPDDIMHAARDKSLRIMPLIANQGFSQALMHSFLASSTAEDAVVSYIVDEALKRGYIGWQFDFEHMMSADRQQFADFASKAADALHARGLILSIAVVAQTDDATDTAMYRDWSGAYDYSQLAEHADFLSVMTYDDPYSIGPTASLPYDKSVLAYLSGKVPPNKLSLGVPFYYYSWDMTHASFRAVSSSSKPVFLGELANRGGTFTRWDYLRKHYGMRQLFDTALGEPYSICYVDG